MRVVSEPAGWYPDPAGGHEWRFWTGTGWSESVADAGTSTLDPLGQPPELQLDRRMVLPGSVAAVAVAAFVLALLVSGVASAGVGALGAGRTLQLAVAAVLLYGALLGFAVAVSRRDGCGRLRVDYGLAWEGFDAVRGLLGALVARAIVAFVLVVALLIGMHLPLNTPSTHGDVPFVLLFGMLAVTVAPVVEELFFRGLLQRALSGSLGTIGAVIAQAALFGAAHIRPVYGRAGIWLGLSLALAGVVLGWLAATYRRLGPSIVAHALFNLVAALALLSQL